MDNTTQLNVAIIGYGAIAKERHKGSIQKTGANLCCIIDIGITETEIEGIPVFKSLEEAQKNGIKIDAVSVCTPPKTHIDVTREALEKGYHVLLEKPPVLELKHLDELEELAKEKGKTLFLAYHTASSPAVYKLQEILRNKNVLQIEANFLEQVTNWHNPNEWIFKKDISGGGVTRDIGINVISAICKTLPGANFKITNSKLSSAEGYQVDTEALIELVERASSAKVKIILDWFNGSENADVRKIKYTTDSGVYILDLSFAKLYEEIEGKEIEIESGTDQEYEVLYKEFIGNIKNGKSYVPHIEAELIDNIYSEYRHEIESEGNNWV